MKIMDFLKALLGLILIIAMVIILLEINFAIRHGYLLPIEKISDFAFLL